LISSLGDAEVMLKVREGELEMLAILFERHHGRLFNFFYRLTGQQGHSEDLVQELFLRVLKYRHTFREDVPFSPWMFQIARNIHLNHLRSLKPEMPLEERIESLSDSSEHPDATMERDQHKILLKRALDRLPVRKREMLMLSRRPDLNYQDLASLFECTVSAVKVQVHRAVKDLRKAFLEVQGGTS
jgi:RNA polymerase sigma-70 factor (ECF subfamily)